MLSSGQILLSQFASITAHPLINCAVRLFNAHSCHLTDDESGLVSPAAEGMSSFADDVRKSDQSTALQTKC